MEPPIGGELRHDKKLVRQSSSNSWNNTAIVLWMLIRHQNTARDYSFQTIPMAVTFDENDLPYSTLYEDHYFSRDDGLAESSFVFLAGNNLPERWRDKDEFVVGELGFGTGLNFLLTWAIWKKTRTSDQSLTFISTEAHLMEREAAAQALSRWPELAGLADQLLDRWGAVNSLIQLDDQTKLQILDGKAVDRLSEFPPVDAWYLDGFAPAKNPEMWSENLMQLVFDRTKQDGSFASYTAAGWVRRNLEAAGFTVEKKAGFGKKRHMITGIKQ